MMRLLIIALFAVGLAACSVTDPAGSSESSTVGTDVGLSFTQSMMSKTVVDSSDVLVFDRIGENADFTVGNENIKFYKQLDDVTAIYELYDGQSLLGYVLLKTPEYIDTNTGVLTKSFYRSVDVFTTATEAEALNESLNSYSVNFEEYMTKLGELVEQSEDYIVHNPKTIFVKYFAGNTLSVDGTSMTFNGKGDTVFNGQTLWLMANTSDKDTMDASRTFVGKFYNPTTLREELMITFVLSGSYDDDATTITSIKVQGNLVNYQTLTGSLN